jgi:predicted O-linked N-acetylglucosamine transferase (SPINDLY family)
MATTPITPALMQAIDAIATSIERGDLRGAEQHAQTALQSFPSEGELWRLLAITQLQSNRPAAAARTLAHAHKLAPRSAEVLCNLSVAEMQCGRLEAACAALEQALRIEPNHIAALTQLGRLRQHLGDSNSAVACFEHIARLQPAHPQAWLDLANVRIAQFQWDSAEALIRHALELDLKSADAWYLAGLMFERSGRMEKAATAYENSLELRPGAYATHNLGLIHDQLGNWEKALQLFARARELDPGLADPLSHLVFAKRRLCDWNGLPALSAQLLAAVDARTPRITPFSFLAEDGTPAQQLACARTFAQQFAGIAGNAFPSPPTASPLGERVQGEGALSRHASQAPPHPSLSPGAAEGDSLALRVGFVSSGFNQHATGLLVVELIERLRASNLITIAFATTADDGTEWRRRLTAGFREFHDVSGRSLEAIVQTISAARCDVLLDIDGYCMGSIPQLFALRTAPIQINWLAYPGSLGAPWYDYLIADHFLIPPEQRRHYDEKIAYLPRSYQPTDTTRTVTVPPPRTACGLPESGFVYCCFNATWKITPHTFALWMRIIEGVPGSVLWLLDGPPNSGVTERLRAYARDAGVDSARLVFTPKLQHADYLARLRHADLFLDTNPYNAHTTASDAIYAGCPVLTRPGATFASRVAGGLNHQLGLDAELNATSDDDYVRRAIEFAQQPDRLAAIRAQLAEPARRARLFDIQAYADDFAALLTRIATRARDGAAVVDISL